jgi:riboflavin kinase/FMN adenylyltransferase
MQTFLAPAEVPADFGPSAVTIGKFDGVHGGHRAVIASLKVIAADRGLRSAVVTFDRNPLSLLRPEACPLSLTSTAQKLELLAGTGIDAALMVTFDREFAALPPEEFVRSILIDALKAQVVFVGSDFRFGARGAGTVEMLRDLGASAGFEVIVVDDVAPTGERRVSSTWVRELLEAGRVREAANLLGALPTIRAEVVHGAERGRTLGYPTANLSQDVEGFVPADGVYAAWLTVGGVRYPAAVSVGNNPTFGGVPEKQVEAHALDQRFDLYGQVVEVSFVDYVRGMRKFSGAEALAEQMRADEQRVREILAVAQGA